MLLSVVMQPKFWKRRP